MQNIYFDFKDLNNKIIISLKSIKYLEVYQIEIPNSLNDPSFLPVEKVITSKSIQLIFDKKNKISLNEFLTKNSTISNENISLILFQIIRVFQKCRKYLLFDSGLIMDPNLLFINNNFELSYIYIPLDTENKLLTDIKEITKLLISKGFEDDSFIRQLKNLTNSSFNIPKLFRYISMYTSFDNTYTNTDIQIFNLHNAKKISQPKESKTYIDSDYTVNLTKEESLSLENENSLIFDENNFPLNYKSNDINFDIIDLPNENIDDEIYGDLINTTILDEEESEIVPSFKNRIINKSDILNTNNSQIIPYINKSYYLRSNDPLKEIVVINKPIFTVGRSIEIVDYLSSNSNISKIHAQIISKNSKLTIKDLDSTNGTFINNKKIDSGIEIDINVGDLIAFADKKFILCSSHY